MTFRLNNHFLRDFFINTSHKILVIIQYSHDIVGCFPMIFPWSSHNYSLFIHYCSLFFIIFHYQLLLTHDFPMIFAWCSSARQSDHRHELSEAQVMAARCGGCYHRWPRFLQLFKVKRNMKEIWLEYERNMNRIWIEYEWNMNGIWLE